MQLMKHKDFCQESSVKHRFYDKNEVLTRLEFASFYANFFTALPPSKTNGWLSSHLLCPFHDERTPSFAVNLKTGRFRCFGCSASGDVFTFTMRINGFSFPDALRYLAEFAGVPPLKSSPQKQIRPSPEPGVNWKRLFHRWESWASDQISRKIRQTERTLASAKNMDDLDEKAVMRLHIWEYHWEILLGDDDEAKYQLFQEHVRRGGNDI